MELGKKIFIFDKISFIRLIDYMGGDDAIVQAARVSYGKGTTTVSDDRKLIRYLMKHKHTSPFEQVEFKFHIKMPIFVARQWVRHRTASLNEYSGRYSEMKNEFYFPDVDKIQGQSKDNNQGSDGIILDEAKMIQNEMVLFQEKCHKEYQKYLNKGVSREVARINLPLSQYTEWYWKMDLHNLFHFLKLRLDKHAQWEIRQYAKVIFNIIKDIVPISCEAFEDYILNSVTYSKQENEIIRKIFKQINQKNFLDFFKREKLSRREKKDFLQKINIKYENNKGS